MSRVFHLSERRAPDDLGFSHFALDRAAAKREDADFLRGAAGARDARFYAISGENVVTKAGDPLDALFAPGELPLKALQRETVFLGLAGDGSARFATLYDDAAAEGLAATSGLALPGVRQAAVEGLLTPDHLGAIAAGKAMLHWHRTHRFCAACGAPSVLTNGGWRRDCPTCKAMHFPRTDPVVIMLAVRGDHCLMGRQPRFIPGMYSCLAGFCEPGETIEDAVRREIHEEAGITTGRIRYLASQPWPFPASLMIGCLAEATSETIVRDETELEDARWFSREEVLHILERRHPDNIVAPGRFAIARVLVKAWARGGLGFND